MLNCELFCLLKKSHIEACQYALESDKWERLAIQHPKGSKSKSSKNQNIKQTFSRSTPLAEQTFSYNSCREA
jgi:hypothetical protein